MLRSGALLGLAIASPAMAVSSVDLGMYQLSATYALPAVAASEASAVTYNWDSDTLFVLGDEGEALVEVSKTGVQLGVQTLTSFDDTEGVTYAGGGRFVLVEERLQTAYSLTFTDGASVDRASLQSAVIGPTIGNIGLEGISFDPITGSYITVKEKTPQDVQISAIDFGAGSAVVNNLFVPSLGVLDLSDVQVLATVPSLTGTADEMNLLVYSQESSRLLEVSRSGAVLSQFDLTGITNAEGVTIDNDGVIYIVGENPELYVLTPIPAPATLAGFAAVGVFAARRRRAS